MVPAVKLVRSSGSSIKPSAKTAEVRIPAPSRPEFLCPERAVGLCGKTGAQPLAPPSLLLVVEPRRDPVVRGLHLGTAAKAQDQRAGEAQEGDHDGDRVAGKPDEGHAAHLAEGDGPPRPDGQTPEVKVAEGSPPPP